jgi:RNA polymerase sigma-70 factor (ECF subfamily)
MTARNPIRLRPDAGRAAPFRKVDMTSQGAERRWQRLGRLLEPIHDRAVETARNLCRSPGEGDDLYQEAVLRAFNKLHTLRDESRFRSWFFAVLLSIHRSRWRRAFWRRFLPLDAASPDAPDPVGDDGRRHEEEFLGARRAARALDRLPADQREAVVLHELEGFSMEAVAEIQGVTVAAVKSRVFRGREKLRAVYRRWGWDTPASAPKRTKEPEPQALLGSEHTLPAGRRS